MSIKLPQMGVVRRILDERHDASHIEVAGLWGAAKTLVAAQNAEALGVPLLILASGRIESEAILDDLTTLVDPERCALFPAWEVLPSDVMDPSDDIVAERLHTLRRLSAAMQSDQPMHVVAPIRALMQSVIAPDALEERSMTLAVGEEYDLDALILQLTELGYERELMVEQRGHMSVRGGIFDIFPISAELPYRLEFFGDEIESIRRFEPETQRSIEHVDSVDLPPRSEKQLLHDNDNALTPFTAYLPETTLLALDEPATVAEKAEEIQRQSRGAPHVLTWNRITEELANFTRLDLNQVAQAESVGAVRIMAPMRSLTSWTPPADDFWSQLAQWDASEYTVVVLCNNTGERRRMLELIEEHGYRLDTDTFDLRVELGRIRAGFVSEADGLAVLSEKEVFGRHYVRRSRRRFEAGEALTSFGDLKVGDYVVHAHHGIGRYMGLRRFEGKDGDFLVVQYAKGDTFYLPVTHIDSIQKFTGGDGVAPKIDRLGGATWAKTKARVKKAVRDMTEELLQLYAARESQTGHAFSSDTPWQVEFEEAFEYEETPDQARSIVEVKRDMEAPRPMDRLLCGDVGYGKTEVALRAAFKGVQDGKQVALLVPTTVLAEQHYLNFVERLADYPIKVDLLCRFRNAKEQKHTIERLRSGEVDIVVGTHRLISKDIKFKNLGLLIIDEEHRFGVGQKERLKHLRATVDVLSMSATPIPRTLNLSLLGVRDMSIINTAPNDRLPVHTCIEPFSETLIREAITRELSRQGQVFFVHNRVHNIMTFASLVQRLVPEARIAVGHGQMPSDQLEHIMTQFIRGDVDVLVCTTIIGSGIDIPNANTIIINNADKFGLSELYQLRGRVGRYKHRAFAYLLIPGDRALTEEAQQRLKALEDFSSLGAGFRIAMRDMEIRGCGNILGGEQHGNIASVGLETYSQLLAEAVAEVRGKPVVRRVLPPFEIAVDAHIPEGYVPSEAQKITLYKRIADVKTVEDVDEMAAELADRFGPVPAPVRRLLDVMRVRAQAADLGIHRITAAKSAVAFEFTNVRGLSKRVRSVLSQQFGDRVSFALQVEPVLTFSTKATSASELIAEAATFLEALEETWEG